jgi:hypothetical protein
MGARIADGPPLAGQPVMISYADTNAPRDTSNRPEFQESVAPFRQIGDVAISVVADLDRRLGRQGAA